MPGGAYAPVMGPPTDGQATLALVLGIVGLACCGGIISPVALFIGNSSRHRIQNSGGTVGGGGLATAGFILGIIGTAILALWVIGVVIRIAAAIITGQ
jgi:Domain of unknown function (DUF4190)